jgi:hypothetical protein
MAGDRELKDVEKRLERKLDEMCERVSEELQQVRVQVDVLDISLRGNGHPGIMTRLAVHDERIGVLTRFADEVQGFKRWVVFGVVSLIASMVLQSVGLFPL